ncbi:hypothetical protein BU15DRAFT_79855 [Melanogaster broomeanus]|nr:hypothetical protein BU15DRAFT_79855 [Melanogaster broomeanus]
MYSVQDTPEAPIHGTLERLATFYLQKIREKQPMGPYHLGGFSFGTYLALIIAKMLQQTGETVDNGEELGAMFASHFKQVSQGTSSSKFTSQFAHVYFGHVLMGIRASLEVQ